MIKHIILIPAIALLPFAAITAQPQKQGKAAIDTSRANLYREIYKQDSLLFDAFNRCDTLAYRRFLSDSFEFYHDLGGLHYLDEEIQSMREMCGRNSRIRRRLIKSTLEIYKLGDYGALEMGAHTFYHTNPGQSEHVSGTYKFVQVWQKTESGWKLSRVISYSHGKMNNN